MPSLIDRINREVEALSDDEAFLRYYGHTLAARREIANGHVPSSDDVAWMKREIAETMLHEERRRLAS